MMFPPPDFIMKIQIQKNEGQSSVLSKVTHLVDGGAKI